MALVSVGALRTSSENLVMLETPLKADTRKLYWVSQINYEKSATNEASVADGWENYLRLNSLRGVELKKSI